jgi:sialidase-1
MKKIKILLYMVFTSYILMCNFVHADTTLINYDANAASTPIAQGWNDFLNGQASGSLQQDLGASSWQANGVSGRAQWNIVPTAKNNSDATANGWKMTWTSRIASGTYITDYYSNGTLRFLPVLSLSNNGDLVVALSGGGTHTLVTATGSALYHDYEIEFNANTSLATFRFDGVDIESSWAGAASSQNTIAWGNGSTATNSVAYYRDVAFTLLAASSPTEPTIAAQWDTSALNFNGASEFLAIDDDLPSVINLSQGSIYTEFQAASTTATIFSVSSAEDESSEFALLIDGDGTLRIHARENGTFVNDSKTLTSYNDNILHKAAVVVSSAGTKIYVDGSLVFTGTSNSFINSVTALNTMNIGRNYDNTGGQWYFTGKVNQTVIYSTVLTDVQAIDLTTKSNTVASYDASLQVDPITLGWINDSADSGSGSLVSDLGQTAWQANGTGGRAEWEIQPSIQVNTDATNLGWKMSTTSRVISGGSITDYYANGSLRFLTLLSINSNGDLVADIEGGGTHTLVSGTGAEQYHNYEMSYNATTSLASFSFDGVVIETWAGSTSSQNVIVWGNGSSGTNGVANYRNVKFETLGTGPVIFESTVFQGGQEGGNGSSNYRIPSLVEAPDGSLLAFIEGRPSSADPGAAGIINISLKRSIDQGRTWLPVQVLHQDSLYDYSDPRPVVDKTTGTIYVFYTQWEDLCAQNGDCVNPGDPNYLLYRSSTDNGVTWSNAVNISAQVKDPTWRSINAGPGQGIQLQWQTAAQGEHNNRLIIPTIVRASNSLFYVVTVFSDDSGATWQKGSFTPISGPTEADMVELIDGKLLLTSRNDGSAPGTRYNFLSEDGGVTWMQTTHDLNLSKVDIGITRHTAVRSGDSENRILVSAPIGTSSGPDRNNLGIWSSTDEGVSFGTPHQIVYGFSAYSDIITLSNGSIGVIYEATGSTLLKFMNFELSAIE